jgi:hypothetical protein
LAKSSFRWEAGFDPGFLLRQIDKIRTVQDGKPSFSAAEYEFWLPVLNSAVVASGRGKALKSSVIRKALSDGSYDLKKPAEHFLTLCETKLSQINSAQLNDYLVFCLVTHQGPRLLTEVKDGDTKIVWDPPKTNRFYKAALEARKSDTLERVKQNCGVNDDDQGVVPVLVFVRALNPSSAYEIGVDALDHLRGIINLLINSQCQINPLAALSSSPPHAINRIRRAPYQTVHTLDGAFAAEMIWYEPRWSHSKKAISFSEPISSHRKTIMEWWRSSKTSALSELLAEGYVRYCRALDNHVRDVSLMELWSSLELLLGTYKNDQLVSRVVRLFDDETTVRQLAEHIRVRRNATIHAGSGTDHLEANTVVIQAQRLVARTLTFLTNDSVPFKFAEEFYQFLDLPLNSKELERQQKLIGEFIKYRRSEGRWKGPPPKKRPTKINPAILISHEE